MTTAILESRLTCYWCGARKPRGSYINGRSGKLYTRCYDCRYEASVTPPPTDPVRVRECWYCRGEFTTSDFSARFCTPKCRSDNRNRAVVEVVSVKDERAIAKAARRIAKGAK